MAYLYRMISAVNNGDSGRWPVTGSSCLFAQSHCQKVCIILPAIFSHWYGRHLVLSVLQGATCGSKGEVLRCQQQTGRHSGETCGYKYTFITQICMCDDHDIYCTGIKLFWSLLIFSCCVDWYNLYFQLITCLMLVLRVQDVSTWNHASTAQIFSALLTFYSHPKPKV